MSDLPTAYLEDITRTFRNYRSLGERALAATPDEHLLTELDANSNSIAVIVKHVSGNFRSRFTDFLTSDGEKPDRDRDAEFELGGAAPARAEIMEWWNDGWAAVLGALEALTPADLERTIYIRKEAFLVAEALNRSATHTAYHVGQIVYLARHFAGPAWASLTIPKGQSKAKAAVGNYKTRHLAR